MCLLCTPPNSAQDYASLEKSSFILSLARISVLGKVGNNFALNLVFLHAATGSRNNHGGPVILQINIFSGSGLPRICFFLALRSGLVSLLEKCLFPAKSVKFLGSSPLSSIRPLPPGP